MNSHFKSNSLHSLPFTRYLCYGKVYGSDTQDRPMNDIVIQQQNVSNGFKSDL